MKQALATSGLLLACLVRAAGAAPSIEFVGVLSDAQGTKLCLADSAVGSGRWLPVGGSFSGYQITAYDSATDTAVLWKDGEERRIPLRVAKVRNENREPPALTAATIRGNLRLLSTAARLHFLEGKSHYVTYADLVGPDKAIKRLTSIAGEDYSGVTLMKGETERIAVTTPSGITTTYEPSTERTESDAARAPLETKLP